MTARKQAWGHAGTGVLAALALMVGACVRETAPVLSASETNRPMEAYRLGLGDKVRVNVYGERELSGEFQVSGNGAIAAPLVGEVPAVGLTARELEASLTGRYAQGFLRQPRIVVEVYDFRPYYVLGEVEKPGQYPTEEGLRLLGAISTAGGYTYRANTRRIYLRRAGEQTEYQVDPQLNITILPGDVIRVGERHF